MPTGATIHEIPVTHNIMRYILLIVLSLFICRLSPAQSAIPPLPLTIADGIGVNIHFTQPQPGEMKIIADAGFKWIRMDIAWNATEREKGVYDFNEYDRLLHALDEYSIRPIFILDYSNRFFDNDLSPHSPEGIEAFAKWAAAAVTHYKGHPIVWEMYNEPNGGFWKPKANVHAYTALALATGKAIHQADPSATYVGPAT